jgi:hypothetical protein
MRTHGDVAIFKFSYVPFNRADNCGKSATSPLGLPWDRCYCGARSGPKDNGTVEVFRVILSRGRVDKSLAAPTEISKFIIRAFRARGRILTKKWYGLKINVFPDKRSTVEYKYDPNCLAEKNFIDVDFS